MERQGLGAEQWIARARVHGFMPSHHAQVWQCSLFPCNVPLRMLTMDIAPEPAGAAAPAPPTAATAEPTPAPAAAEQEPTATRIAGNSIVVPMSATSGPLADPNFDSAEPAKEEPSAPAPAPAAAPAPEAAPEAAAAPPAEKK